MADLAASRWFRKADGEVEVELLTRTFGGGWKELDELSDRARFPLEALRADSGVPDSVVRFVVEEVHVEVLLEVEEDW